MSNNHNLFLLFKSYFKFNAAILAFESNVGFAIDGINAKANDLAEDDRVKWCLME